MRQPDREPLLQKIGHEFVESAQNFKQILRDSGQQVDEKLVDWIIW